MIPLYDENRPTRKPYVNYALIAMNVVVFFFFCFQDLKRSVIEYGAIPIFILNGKRLFTLFTSMFLHADILHLLGNMLYLWIFGDNVEDAFGHLRYLIFYLVGGIFAGLVHIASTLLSLYARPIPYVISELTIPAVGASGAISAVLGAYLLLYPNARIKTLVFYFFIITFVSVPAFYYLGFWFIFQLFMGLISLSGIPSGVAFWAHIGGFVYGLLMIKAFNIKPRRKPVAKGRRVYRPIVAPWVREPLVDVFIELDRVVIMAYLPGVREEDIELTVSEWEVIIAAQHEDVRFYKRIALPVPVVPKIVDFMYSGGVLRFTLYRIA